MQNKETKKIKLVRKQKSYIPYALGAIALTVLLLLTVYAFARSYTSTETTTAMIGNKNFLLEVARTDVAREKGLSERDYLGDSTGMLFVFNEPGDWRMWMVQMRFPIDIAWLNEEKRIITIKRNATPAEYPEVYKAVNPSLYVIEVPSGTFDDLGVKEGDSISFSL